MAQEFVLRQLQVAGASTDWALPTFSGVSFSGESHFTGSCADR